MIQVLDFHPSAPVLLTAGFDKTIRLFHIDGKENPKLQSFHFKDLPIFSANFIHQNNEIILTGRRNYFYSLNMDSLKTLRINGVRGMNFN